VQESAERRQVGQGMERGQGFKRTQDPKMASFSFFGLNSSRFGSALSAIWLFFLEAVPVVTISRLPHTTPKVKTLVKW